MRLDNFVQGLSLKQAKAHCKGEETVATCHIQYTFLSLCQFCFHEKTWEYLKSSIFIWYENGRWQLLDVQSINSERVSLGSDLTCASHPMIFPVPEKERLPHRLALIMTLFLPAYLEVNMWFVLGELIVEKIHTDDINLPRIQTSLLIVKVGLHST